jgi:hypothetical protein
MADENDIAIAEDKASEADFAGGFSGVEGKPDKPAVKEKPEPAAAPQAAVEPAPEFVQVTAKEWAEIKAAAARTASYDSQFSKLFGTTGNLTKLLNEQRANGKADPTPPAAPKFVVPKEAFAEMERDFPELAKMNRAALEAALSGLPLNGANDAQDPAKLESLLAQYTNKRELEALEDAFPTWKEIVGAVDGATGQPPADNAFRKWLATKDEAYQTRINSSETAAVIGRAIRTFQKETAVPPKIAAAKPRDDARADRIKSAITPRGDNAGAAGGGKTDEDEFAAGFNSR